MNGRLDGTAVLLFAGMFLSLTACIVIKYLFPTDGQMFQVAAGLIAMFGGALFRHIPGGGSAPAPSPAPTAGNLQQ